MRGEVPGKPSETEVFSQPEIGESKRGQVEYRGPLKNPTKLPMEEAVRPPPAIPRPLREPSEESELHNLFVAEECAEPFSEREFLRTELSPYLDEYPFLHEDIETLKQLRDTLRSPLPTPERFLVTGSYDAGYEWIEQERDRQIRAILDRAKVRRSHEDSLDIQ